MNSGTNIVWVLGAGASGEAAAELLRAEGVAVTVLDAGQGPAQTAAAARLAARGVEVRLGAESLPEGRADLCVVSPGIPDSSAWVVECARRGVPCRSELELGWSRRTAPVLAVTGSNGKTTLVRLLEHVLGEAGLRVRAAGNIGPPLAREVRGALDWLVVEVSSFQLETVEAFRPEIGILLNLFPNHLDRHGTMEHYARLKARLFARTVPADLCIVPTEWEPRVRDWSQGRGRWLTFGPEPGAAVRHVPGALQAEGKPVVDLRGTLFDNRVMGATAASAWAAAAACGVSLGTFERALSSFQPPPHRMQAAGSARGVRFVNDSKATNLAAMAAGVQRCAGAVRLIAGGLPKESDFDWVKDLLAERVASAYLIGSASRAMSAAWSDAVVCRECGDLDRAFSCAVREARSGETVLLSPGCASFDQFSSYQERGQRFLDLVRQEQQREDRVDVAKEVRQ